MGTLGNLVSTTAIIFSITSSTSSYSGSLGWDSIVSHNFPNLLLVNLCLFDTLFCAVVMPHHAWGYFYEDMTLTEAHCKTLGFVEKWLMYGERAALAVMALSATSVLNSHLGSTVVAREAKLLLPWVLAMFYILPTFLGLFPSVFGQMVYSPTLGQCTISSMEVIIVMEILGTYLPFAVMVLSYWKIHQTVCTRQRYLSDHDENARYSHSTF